MKASTARVAASPSKTRRAKTRAAKTAMFLVHCRGRRARNQAGSRWGFTGAGVETSGASDAEVDEATFTHPGRVEDVTTVEHHRLFHQLLHSLEVGPPEIVPLREDEESIGGLERLVGRLGVAHPIAEMAPGHIGRDRIVCRQGGAFAKQSLDHHQRGGLSHVVGARLEGQAPDGEVLASEVPVVANGLLDEKSL